MDTPSTQTTVSKVELPDWVDAAAQENLDIADKLSERPYVPYEGSLTAGQSALQKQAAQLALRNAGAWFPTMDDAIDAAREGSDFQPGSFRDRDISAYMNPYLDEVEKRALANADTALKQSLNTIGDSAIAAGAFGGSRHGIAEGVAASETARHMGDLSAQLRAQGFDTAAGLLQDDLTREMQGQQLRLDAASQLGELAKTGGVLGNQNAALLATLGEQQRQIEQQRLQEAYGKWKERMDYPLQQLNLRLAALGATPYGSTQSQTTTGQGGTNTGMQLIGAGLSLLPFLFMSDKREKTDIEKVGKDPATGLTLYAYRYKGDPKTYPKVVGPVAQDVEKKFPGAVTEIGGKKIIRNLGFAGV